VTHRRHVTRVAAGLATATLLTATAAMAAAAPASSAAAHQSTVKVRPAVVGHVQAVARTSPLPTSQCLALIGIHCYSPLQYRAAYNLNPLYQQGIDGTGRTIVIVDSFGSPTIQHDLEMFDAQWGLPNTTVQIVQQGVVPPFDAANPDMVGWAEETTLDVEYAHAIAPGAHIVLLETAVAETEGVTGFPEMMTGEKSLIDQGIGDVISQSFGATENTFPGYDTKDFSSLLNLRYAFTDAALHGVTVLGASGDAGATDWNLTGTALYPYPVNSWPSSDPLVTSVGGTQMTLDDAGNRLAPDVVWNDGFGAGGGGLSGVFDRPIYQYGVSSVVGNHRGTPDISMSAAVDGGCWVYFSFIRPTSPWHIFGGTSEASPIMSGIVAMADQRAGHRLGNLNIALYALGFLSQIPNLPVSTGLVDVTSGDNSFSGVTGYPAGTGYDLSSGWGTIDGAKFITALSGP
jgi:subtilase family serine protease